MASTAKNTHKNTRTYASAVAGVTEKSIFSTLAKCQLKKPRNMPNARIPNTTETHSFFIDLKSTDASEEEVLRSEEHTSELQSLTNLVCRLLLEKKKKLEK